MSSLAHYIPRFERPAHGLYVCRLYKRSLRLCSDWYWDKEEYRQKAYMVRQLYEQNKRETNPKVLEELLLDTEFQLAKYFHPLPYKCPTAPGGSKWERNAPLPEEVIQFFIVKITKRYAKREHLSQKDIGRLFISKVNQFSLISCVCLCKKTLLFEPECTMLCRLLGY